MNTTTRLPLYPMSIGSVSHGPVMHIMCIETARGPVYANMAHFIGAQMSGGALFLRFADMPPVKAKGCDLDMFEVAIKRFK